MTILSVMPDDSPETIIRTTTDKQQIAEHLASLGVAFSRLPVLAADAPPLAASVLDRNREVVETLMAEGGFGLVDVAMMTPDENDPEWPVQAAKARATFRDEHSHAEDEVRLFVSGAGCFYLHLAGEVHAVVCTAGDLLSVPAGTSHWFDMGERPQFCAIRFFQNEDGWVGEFAADSIAARFPTLDDLLSERV